MPPQNSSCPLAPIAIVGLSCRLPGAANSPEKLWELLKGTDDAWSAVPADRFNGTAFHHPSSDYPNGTNHQNGGYFIEADLRDFDHSFFRLSPQQAAAMDPQQRMLLEMSYEALESAGWTLKMCAGSNMGVYAASFTADFERNLYRDPINLPTYYLTGVEKAILSNRISHALDLHGPSMTIDTACSGGLVAVHQACQSLRSGESDAAIVGAANLTMGPDHHIGMSKLHLISGSGHCYPFDSRGDGYGRGEGCVVLILKRLDLALRDRDPVRAILVNTGVNQDGYTPASITYPNGAAQEKLIRDTYRTAGLSPLHVSYVEAHGTGTKAGDTEEITAISKAFLPEGSKRSAPLNIGSMKGHIGHTENTSGLASILKGVLMLENLQIPGTVGLKEFKSSLPLDGMCFPRDLVAWPREHDDQHGNPPRVSINSFGFGGTNAHAILERVSDQPILTNSSSKTMVSQPLLLPLSANSQASLRSMLASYSTWAQQHPDVALEDLSYTLCHRRSVLPWRYSCVADGYQSFLSQIQPAVDYPLVPPPREPPAVVFIFTGQGAQWLGMARELLLDTGSSVFRDSILASRDVLLDLGADWDLEQELLLPSTEATPLNTAQLAQPATTAVQIALVSMLRSFNIMPGAVVGHSSGEIAAAYAAGHISAQDALLIAYHRGFMADVASSRGLGPGAMLSVGLSESDAVFFTKDLTQGAAEIACVNSPNSVTVSGDAEAVDEVALRIETSNRQGDSSIFYRRLAVDTAYHSHHMRGVAEDYRARLVSLEDKDGAFDERAGEVMFFSSMSATLKSSGFGPAYWTDNLVSAVRFSDAIQTLAKSHTGFGHNIFVEIGPHPTLAGPVRQCLMDPKLHPQMSFDYYPVLQRKINAITSTLNLAGRLFERGVTLDLQNVSTLSIDVGSGIVLTDLPAYTWDHSQKHLSESRISREYRMRHDPYHDLLGVPAMDATSIEPRWRHMIGLNSLPWLGHHLIDHQPVFPGSGYICMAIEGLMQFHKQRYHAQDLESITLTKVSFLRGLAVPEIPGQQTEVQLSLTPRSVPPLTFDFRIAAFWDDEWREHCTGVISGTVSSGDAGDEAGGVQMAHLASAVQPQPSSAARSIEPAELYRQMADAGNIYGPTFSSIREYILDAEESHAFSTVEVPDVAVIMPAHHQQPHLIHPATLDTVFHTCLPILAHHLGHGAMVPVHIDEILVSATSAMPREPKSILKVSTSIQSRQHRSASTDVCATTGGTPVLVASGIHIRSLAPHSNTDGDLSKGSATCHKIDWAPDIQFLRVRDFSSGYNLTELIRHVLYKHERAAVLEIGSGQADLALAFLGSLNGPESTWPVYDYTSAAAEPPQRVREQLMGYPVQYRSLVSGSDIYEQGFKPHSYEVVLISGTQSLPEAHLLLKAGGTVILELKSRPDDNLVDHIREAQLETQLSIYDSVRNSLIIIARPMPRTRTNNSSLRIRMLTHSHAYATQRWVDDVENWLRGEFSSVSRNTIQATNPFTGPHLDEKESIDCFIVVEDQTQPILSDPACFYHVMSLLKQSSRIIWLSQNEPLSMHQITGVARTAHAENGKLCLTTIHVASQLLSSESGHLDRLLDILDVALESDGPAREREYQVDEAGIVTVPRLLPDESLNHATQCGATGHDEVAHSRFLNNSCDLTLPQGKQSPCGIGSAIFHACENNRLTLAADDEVELDTQCFLLSKSTLQGSYCAYSGIITRVGANVENLQPGDQVVTVGASAGANRQVVPEGHVGRLPPGVPPAVGTRMLIHVMEACHALQKLAHLTSKGRVLIHGSLTALGRAAVAVARNIGATVRVSTTSPEEARRVTKELRIPPDMIVPITRHKPPRNLTVGDVDVVVTCVEEVPVQTLACLKTFGNVVVLCGESSRPEAPRDLSALKVPRNSVVYTCEILQLLSVCPALASGLVAQAAAALSHLPLLGLDYCARPVHQVSKALQLIETAACDEIIIQADRNSIVPMALNPRKKVGNASWNSADASYLVAGGLGDLGRRLLRLMAQRGAKHLVTLSRTPCTIDEHCRLQEQLRAINPSCTLYCLSCDLTQVESVQKAAACFRRLQLPEIRGIIQSAAVLQDRTLDTMTHNDFARAASVKVEGTLELEKYFASPKLAFFLTLSSAVNILGASGQANYNAGNSVQDAMSWARRGTHCRYMSLSPGWIDDAAFTIDNESRLNGLRRAGLRPISPEELTRCFDYVLGAAEDKLRTYPAQAIIGLDAVSIANSTTTNGTVHSPLFCHIRTPDLPRAASPLASSSTDEVTSFAEATATGDSNLILEVVATSLASHLSRLMSLDISRIDRFKTTTLDLGVDSLVSLELRNWIVREFCAPLQSSEILVDQTINSLAEKILSHVKVASQSTSQDSRVEDNVVVRTPATTTPGFTPFDSVLHETPNGKTTVVELPSVPKSGLETILGLFQQSREAIDSTEEQNVTAGAVRDFLDGQGPSIHQKWAEMSEDSIADAYERHLYLQRREPLQNYSTFVLVHPVAAPSHSQAARATILTVAAIEFARQISAGNMTQDELNGAPLDCESREWLFHTIRRPGQLADRMERFAPNKTVVVLRRGHAFEMTLPQQDDTLVPAAIHAAYNDILDASEEFQADVSTFTADERQSWAQIRSELERQPENAQAFAAIDRCAFVVCLDDGAPVTGGERFSQFLLNGPNSWLSNRWFDKSFQLVVGANGVSAGIYEHAKLDGIDARSLHHHLTTSIFSHPLQGSELGHTGMKPDAYRIRRLKWRIDNAHIRLINRIQIRDSSYGLIEQKVVQIESLGSDFIRAHRAQSNATAHLTVLVAMYLVDREIRPAWEVASLATFRRGRIDWVQTVTSAVKTFIEGAVAAEKATDNMPWDDGKFAHLRDLFDAATAVKSRLISSAASGFGYVKNMYALLAALDTMTDGGGTELPALFRSGAWNATRRGGPGQDLKIGFMPTVNEHRNEWDEGGFLMEGERGVYVHCAVEEQQTKFSVSAQPAYAELVCKELKNAADIMSRILRF